MTDNSLTDQPPHLLTPPPIQPTKQKDPLSPRRFRGDGFRHLPRKPTQAIWICYGGLFVPVLAQRVFLNTLPPPPGRQTAECTCCTTRSCSASRPSPAGCWRSPARCWRCPPIPAQRPLVFFGFFFAGSVIFFFDSVPIIDGKGVRIWAFQPQRSAGKDWWLLWCLCSQCVILLQNQSGSSVTQTACRLPPVQLILNSNEVEGRTVERERDS